MTLCDEIGMLQINQMDVFRVRRPLITPWQTAYGTETAVESVFIRSTSPSGHVAWVESCPLSAPLYLPESAGSAFRVVVDHMAPAVIGKSFDDPVKPFDLLSQFKGNSFAKAAIDFSYWAQFCLVLGKPLHDVLFGTKTDIPIGRGFSITGNPGELKIAIDNAVSNGCKRAKIKVTPDTSPDDLNDIRQTFPDLPMFIDCNGSLTMDDEAMLRDIDRMGFQLIEQPFHYKDFFAHAALQAELTTPVCLDESICDVHDALTALALTACRAMALKPGRVGGITPFRRILGMCKGDVNCYVGGMLESGLGTAMNIELSTLDGLELVPDIPASGQYFTDELVEPELAFTDGMAQPTDQPWVGCTVNEERLLSQTVEQATVS